MPCLTTILRTSYFPKSTIGKVSVQSGPMTLYRGWSLELPWKENKVRESCVIADEYDAIWTFSPHFKREMWELLEVTGRSAIRMHSAAIAVDHLLGCIAQGLSIGDINKDGSMDLLRSKGAGQRMFDETTVDLAEQQTFRGKSYKHMRVRILSGNGGLDTLEGMSR